VCILEDLRDGGEEASYDPCQLQIKVPRKTIKAARRSTGAILIEP